jgi:hypothetical protein
MYPVRGKKVMIQSVLLCCKDFHALVVTHPVYMLYAGHNERIAIHMLFPPPSNFSLLQIIRPVFGLMGGTSLLTFL